MTNEDVKEKLSEIFRDVFDDETIIIFRETTANDIDDWDSLAHISLVVAIEKEFNIKFSLIELKPLKNVGDMMDIILKKIS